MSQYLQIFARHNEQFIPIADYSRNSKVYEEVEVPYGKIRQLDKQELKEIAERLRAGKNFANAQIRYAKSNLKFLAEANNSLQEKMEHFHDTMEMIEAYEEDINLYERYAIQFEFIAEMTYDNSIFAGVEISDPTEDDIV